MRFGEDRKTGRKPASGAQHAERSTTADGVCPHPHVAGPSGRLGLHPPQHKREHPLCCGGVKSVGRRRSLPLKRGVKEVLPARPIFSKVVHTDEINDGLRAQQVRPGRPQGGRRDCVRETASRAKSR